MHNNIVLTGRSVTVCYRLVEAATILGNNLSLVDREINLWGMLPFSVVQSVSFAMPAGVEILSAPPVPYPTVALPAEVPPIDVTVNTLWTPNEKFLLSLYNVDYYLPLVADILVVDKTSGGGIYFPSCLPRSLEFRYDEGGRPLQATYGFLAPAVFIIPAGGAPPYAPSGGGLYFVRHFTSILGGTNLPSPLTVTQLSVTLNENITAQHTALAAPPSTQQGLSSLRFARLFTKGVPSVGLQMRTFSSPVAPPSAPLGAPIEVVLIGADLATFAALLGIGVRGYVRNISTDINPDGGVFFNVDVVGGSSPAAPPIAIVAY